MLLSRLFLQNPCQRKHIHISRSRCSLLMITIYQVIQVVLWFYSSITFASVVVCMHANWSWSQVHLLGNWHRHTEAGFAIIYCHAKPFCWLYTMPHMCVPSRYNSGVNFWSKPVWSWTNGNMGKATCQQCPNNMLLDKSERILAHQLPFAVLSVVSEWVIGHWLWIHVMNCAHDFSPLDTQTMPAGYSFSWTTCQSYQRSIKQSMMLSWRECVLYNGVIRSDTLVVLDMVAVTHIRKPQRGSIFGEYTHMQLMPCLQSYMTENMSYFGSLVKSFSGTQLICITSSSYKCWPCTQTDMTALSPCQQKS